MELKDHYCFNGAISTARTSPHVVHHGSITATLRYAHEVHCGCAAGAHHAPTLLQGSFGTPPKIIDLWIFDKRSSPDSASMYETMTVSSPSTCGRLLTGTILIMRAHRREVLGPRIKTFLGPRNENELTYSATPYAPS